jgi:hypothetical protein
MLQRPGGGLGGRKLGMSLKAQPPRPNMAMATAADAAAASVVPRGE